MARNGQRRAGLRKGWILLPLAAVVLSACQTGDFGRRKAPAFYDAGLGVIGPVAAGMREEPVSWYLFTDHEKDMRAMAYRFGMPPRLIFDESRILYDLQYKRVFPSHFPPIDPEAYHLALRTENPRSHETFFRMISADALADIELLAGLTGVILQVYSDDTIRLRAALKLDPNAAVPGSPAIARVDENRLVVDTVRYKLRERYAAYEYAYRRYVIEVPSPAANETEAVLERYRVAMARLDADLAHKAPGFRDKNPLVLYAR